MSPPIAEVIEIQSQSEQGFQQPFLCKADDGESYYVKGRQTTRASLYNEWICANLAAQLKLPMPPFKLLNVSEEILEEAPTPWKTLGCGIAFGSQLHLGCSWFDQAQVQHVPFHQQVDILAFDWWIQNSDRTSWNPNLLWEARQGSIVMIDHNLAFEPTLTPQDFIASHIFRECWPKVDLVMRDLLQHQFCNAMDAVLEKACHNLPEEWQWNNPECDVAANVDLPAIKATLAKCKGSDFWRFA